MGGPQPGVLAPVPGFSRYLEFGLRPDQDAAQALRALANRAITRPSSSVSAPGWFNGSESRSRGFDPSPA